MCKQETSGLGARRLQRPGLRGVLMPEHSEAEISFSVSVNTQHSHKKVVFSKYPLTLFLVQRGRTETLQPSSSSDQRRSQIRIATGSVAAEASRVPSYHPFSLARFFLKQDDNVSVSGGRFVRAVRILT